MRAVLQRVTRASVTVDGEVLGKIGKGFMILLGVENSDTEEEVSSFLHTFFYPYLFTDCRLAAKHELWFFHAQECLTSENWCA